MTMQTAMTLTELKETGRMVEVIQGKKVLFIWHNDQVYAIQSQCPHLKLPLTKGKITDDLAIICPFHKSSFNLNTGKPECWSSSPPIIGPLLGKLSKEKALIVYPTEIKEDRIMININEHSCSS